MVHRAVGLAVILAIGVACGDVNKRGGGDAGHDDDDSDSGVPDALAVGEVAVTLNHLFDNGVGPSADTPTLFIPPEGEGETIETTTDAEGRAAATVPAGSTVVFFPLAIAAPAGAPAEGTGIAIMGVEPGDDIVISDELERGDALGTMTFQLPVLISASSYVINTGCSSFGSNASVITVTAHARCVIDGDLQFLASAQDGAGEVLGFIAGQVPFVDGNGVGTSDWNGPDRVRVNLSTLPNLVQSIGGGLEPIKGLLGFSAANAQSVSPAPDPTVLDLQAPRGFGSGRIVAINYGSSQPGLGNQVASYRLGSSENQLDLEVEGELLPWFGPSVYSVEERQIITSRTAGAMPDVQAAVLFWNEVGGPSRTWIVMAPPELERIPLPRLPAAYADRLPVAPDPERLGAGMFGIEVSEWDGYREARQHGFDALLEEAPLRLDDGGSLRRSNSAGGF